MRMVHPELEGREIVVADDPEVVALHESQGWKQAPELVARPGYVSEPAPVEKPRSKPSKKSTDR